MGPDPSRDRELIQAIARQQAEAVNAAIEARTKPLQDRLDQQAQRIQELTQRLDDLELIVRLK
jgi:hypothetical protein